MSLARAGDGSSTAELSTRATGNDENNEGDSLEKPSRRRAKWLDALKSRPDPLLEEIPDGGLKAWLQVVLGHLTNFNTFGSINSFGIFQAYYTASLHSTPSSISWVGSVAIFLTYFVGTFSGRAVDAGYFHLTTFCGFFLQILGMFMASIAGQYWQLFLAQGLCQGIGNGLLFCPIIALVTTYFGGKKRAVALAFVASGGASGGLVFPAIAQSLLPKIGLPWTVRIMAFVMLFNAVFALAFSRTRVPPRATGPLIDWSAFKDLPYMLFSFGVFFTLWGTFYAFYYVRPYARDVLDTTEYTSFSLLLVINGIGFPGRVIPSLISLYYLGPLNTFIPWSILGGVLLYTWTAVGSVNGLFAFAAVFGLFGAGVQSLFPAAVSSLTGDMKSIGVRIGMVFSIASPAALTGPPIAGALVTACGGRYIAAQLFGGTSMVLGGLLVLAARFAKVGFTLKGRL